MTQDSSDLKDIKKLCKDLPKREPVVVHEDTDSKYGVFGDEITWLRQASGETYPSIEMPRIALFAAHHGFALKGPEGSALKEHQENIIHRILGNTHTVCNLAKSLNCDLRLYEMDLDNPTQDTVQGAAMEAQEASMAISYGMMAVEEQTDFLILGSLGAGSRQAAKNILELLDKDAKIDPFDVLVQIGGYEIAALCGVVLASYLGNKPVFIDGSSGLAAVKLMSRLNPLLGTHVAAIGLENTGDIRFLSHSGDSDDLCGRSAFKLAQMKVLLGLIAPSGIDLLQEQQAQNT